MAKAKDYLPGSRALGALLVAGLLLWVGKVTLRWWDEPSMEALDRLRSSLPANDLLTEVTESSEIDFVHRARASNPYFFPNIMGSGCAFIDFDQDGDLDLYLVNGGTESGRSDMTASNRLYRQDAPKRFVDVTSGSGLESTAFGMGVAAGDVNNDGYPDLYVTNHGPDRLYLNQRDGRFQDVTEEAEIDNPRWGASACFLDYDRDGWLDLYVTNYVDYYPSKTCLDPRGQTDFCGPQVFFGTADKLYRNVPGGSNARDGGEPLIPRFSDESLSSGVARQSGPGLGVLSADFNGDAWPDIYVANDGTPNWLWMNQRDGTFVDEAVLRGCATDVLGRSQAGMGLALGDTDGDGLDEVFVTHLHGEMNALYRIRDGLQFQEESRKAGLGEPSLSYTGFGTAMLDLEHDGDLDVLVVNGRVKRPASGAAPHVADGAQIGADPRFWDAYAEPNQIFLNEGGKFRVAGPHTEPYSAAAEVSRGLAIGDVDNDGDIDVLVTNTAGKARLFLNESEKRGSWLVVRAIEPALGGRDACGAIVSVTAGGHTWRRHVNPGFSYLSSSDPRVHFGLGPVEQIERIEVRWPDGSTESFVGGPANQFRVLRHGEGDAL